MLEIKTDLEPKKRYNTKTIRAVLIIFMEMLNSNEIDFEYFNEYTGLSRTTYYVVRKIIKEMIIDLKLNVLYEIRRIVHITRQTKYYTHKFMLKLPESIDYSYHLSDELYDIKRMDYSFTIVYLMLKNKEDVNLRVLSKIFPNYTKHKNYTLMHYLRDIVDGDLYIEKWYYKLKDWDYE